MGEAALRRSRWLNEIMQLTAIFIQENDKRMINKALNLLSKDKNLDKDILKILTEDLTNHFEWIVNHLKNDNSSFSTPTRVKKTLYMKTYEHLCKDIDSTEVFNTIQTIIKDNSTEDNIDYIEKTKIIKVTLKDYFSEISKKRL